MLVFRCLLIMLYDRVNVGGKLDVVCFDKTGTLTEDGLDVLGVRAVSSNQRFVPAGREADSVSNELRCSRFSELLSETSAGLLLPPSTANSAYDLEKQQKVVYAMATCHSLRVVDGELLGDPLDVKMFQFTGWSYEEGGGHSSEQTSPKFDTISPSVARPPAAHVGETQNNGPNVRQLGPREVDRSQALPQIPVELGVLRNFEFVSQLRRASVVVRQFGDSGATFFVKGAPESIKDICIPETRMLPALLSRYLPVLH